ncbi:helix-turn-helix domain-containing protein [Lentzea sp. NPDC092896]|uniref:helix-turn-helix domain-containing protein n=1 Tax=Lentzea sp. NPDC092896 TaxID=3364127 RepID=UPI003820451B
MAELSVREAAERLEVNQARIRALLAAGQLAGRRIGSQWVVHDDAVQARLEIAASDRGRPLSTRSAWCAAALLDKQEVSWLSTSERSRLRARLSRHPSSEVCTYRWWMQRRARTVRYRVAGSDIPELLKDQGVVAGGISAASHYALGLAFGGEAEIYVNGSDAARLVDEFFLVESDQGNLLVHIDDSGMQWHQRTAAGTDNGLVAPRLVVAADLMDSADSRSRSAGAQLLEQALSTVLRSTTLVAA